MGWENIFHCEWNPFGQKVLKHHFPKAISYNDITQTDFTIHRGRIDIITGGFPCQPYSSAGKRLGKEDERHLWPHMLRCIREVSPRWVVGENVLGLVNWSGGLVFHEVQADLEAEGYEVQPFILPAAAVNAPHKRMRVFFVAYSNERNDGRASGKDERESGAERIQERDAVRQSIESGQVQRNAPDTCSSVRRNSKKGGNRRNEQGEKREKSAGFEFTGFSNQPNAPDSDSERSQRRRKCGELGEEGQGRNELLGELGNLKNRWEKFPTKPPICGGDDGLPRELDGITFPKWRNESIKAYGNAIVPQVAHQIFKAIAEYEIL